MSKLIENISFRVTIYDRGWRILSFWFEPEDICKVFQYYSDICRNLKEFDELLINLKEQKKLTQPTKDLGRNDSSLQVFGDKTILNCEYVSGYPPLEIKTEEVIDFFQLFRNWYADYEFGKIPGLIPKSRLDSWSCVPNEYVKPEYWEKVKKKREDGEEV
ncbi:hypothetical protein [Membranihabitans maritimus]|uniref:hypothetical protein n=1 Tax=Membranihabitans maritimus TaxID=2904244 RepID=UPI001F336263|nr:hypothetical protein [Membranihabitans maritimus]